MSMLKRTAIAKIGHDPDRAKHVIANQRMNSRPPRAAKHTPRVSLNHWLLSNTVAWCQDLARNGQPLGSSLMPAASMWVRTAPPPARNGIASRVQIGCDPKQTESDRDTSLSFAAKA